MNKCPQCGAYIPDGGRMCISCGWKPEGGNGMFDNPIFQYMQDAFEKAGPQMTGDDKIPDEFRERDLAGKPVKKINTMILVALAFLGARNAYFGKKEPVPYVGRIFAKLLEVF